ncbi:MAG: DUF4838 domain-containing protein [Negativicutes bacterium]|nr:DUF4838 domain-containing protein [Negativicutes bacterium]
MAKICLLIISLLFVMPLQVGALEIVLPDKPDYFEIKASEEIKALCGNVKALRKVKVYVGRARSKTNLFSKDILGKIKEDGFAVVSDSRNVAVYGRPGPGVLYGVYGFFRLLGGEIYAHDSIRYPDDKAVLKPLSVIQNPAFSLRRLDYGFYYWPKKMHNVNNTRLGFSPSFILDRVATMANTEWYDPDSRSGYEHTQGSLCPPRIYLKTHPEFFARDEKGNSLINEKTSGSLVHLCLSNSKVRQIAKERLLKWMESAPMSTYFQIGEGDDFKWCRCPACRKLDPRGIMCFDVAYAGGKYPAHLADRMLNYVNDLASATMLRYPEKKLLVLAYDATSQVPVFERPANNVIMLLCADPLAGNLCAGHAFCSKNYDFWKQYSTWKNVIGVSNMAVYEYIINYKNIYAPFFCLDSMAIKIKRYHDDGIDKIGFNGHPYLFTELYFYILGKLLWNPQVDTRILEKEFLNAYYGPASAQMSKVLALLRESMQNQVIGSHQTIFSISSPLINSRYCAAAYTIFSEAERVASKNPKILWRVRYAKLCAVLWGDLDQMVNRNPIPKLRELAIICREAPDPMLIHRLTSNLNMTFKTWSKKHFGFELDEKTWLDDPRFK